MFIAVKADRKQNAKQFNPQHLLFRACCCCKQLAKHNAKDDARPKAKAAYHRINELKEDLDEEDSANEKAESSNNEDDSDNYNVDCLMNVFAL